MAKEDVSARYQVKDEEGNAVMDSENKAVWQEATVSFDFGENLDAAVDLCGSDVVFSQYKANAKVALQGIIRAKLKANVPVDQIQSTVDSWKPGMIIEATKVDPQVAIQNAFQTWSPEKRAEFLASLGVQA